MSFRHETWHSAQRVQSWLHQTREFCFSWSESHLGAYWQILSGLSCIFHRGVASCWPLYHKGLIGGVLQRCCTSGRFYHVHRGTLELCQCDHWVPGHLPDQDPSPLITHFCQTPSLRKSPGDFKLLSFTNGDHCVLWDCQCFQNVSVPFPRSVPRYNSVSEVYRQFL